MFYSGKTIDSFENAMNQMLDRQCGFAVKNLDCISLRNFGYGMGEHLKEWFSPLISLEKATENLSEVLKGKFVCRKFSLSENWEIPYGGVVIGPLSKGIAAPEIRNYYYTGKGYYVYVDKSKKDKVEVFDPQGISGLTIEKKEIIELAIEETIHEVYLGNSGISNCNDNEEILARGLMFHEKVQMQEKDYIDKAVSEYIPNTGNKIALRYSIINLLLQMDKIFSLAEENNMLSIEAANDYMRCKKQLYDIGNNENVCKIQEVVSRIWEILR